MKLTAVRTNDSSRDSGIRPAPILSERHNALLRLALIVCLLSMALLCSRIASAAVDHGYQQLDGLLAKHVKWTADGTASKVDYAGFQQDRQALGEVLARLSSVSQAQFGAFSRDQQLAFLINAYNAFTVELILTKYPDLDSIKDLGGLFTGSPWSKEFFSLLGARRTLDWIEHEQIRGSGRYNDPRIHFVVNCASIGCPALRPEALTAQSLEASLEDSTKRFFSDDTRNFHDPKANVLRVTKLLDWYEEDFTKGHLGVNSVREFLARYAQELSDDPAVQKKIAAQQLDYEFTDYDWDLNKQ